MNDQAIEQEIQAKGLTAPRITPADIEANIVSEHYFTAGEGVAGATGAYPNDGHPGQPLALLTFCVLVLKNGFTVTGESACASPENFDAEIGRKIARENAVQKIWPLMGYELRSQLAKPVNVDAIAKRAHEVNRAYCASIGDHSQPAWEDAPQWQKDSAIAGVRAHLHTGAESEGLPVPGCR